MEKVSTTELIQNARIAALNDADFSEKGRAFFNELANRLEEQEAEIHKTKRELMALAIAAMKPGALEDLLKNWIEILKGMESKE